MKLIYKVLVNLASLEAQRRYIIHGDEEFLLPGELLDQAHNSSLSSGPYRFLIFNL
jgi:hypothetical protein